MESFYKHFEDIKDNYYDGLISWRIAPVEKMDLRKWIIVEELTQVFECFKRHVFLPCTSSWGAQAGLYHRYGFKSWALWQIIWHLMTR